MIDSTLPPLIPAEMTLGSWTGLVPQIKRIKEDGTIECVYDLAYVRCTSLHTVRASIKPNYLSKPNCPDIEPEFLVETWITYMNPTSERVDIYLATLSGKTALHTYWRRSEVKLAHTGQMNIDEQRVAASPNGYIVKSTVVNPRSLFSSQSQEITIGGETIGNKMLKQAITMYGEIILPNKTFPWDSEIAKHLHTGIFGCFQLSCGFTLMPRMIAAAHSREGQLRPGENAEMCGAIQEEDEGKADDQKMNEPQDEPGNVIERPEDDKEIKQEDEPDHVYDEPKEKGKEIKQEDQSDSGTQKPKSNGLKTFFHSISSSRSK